MNLKNFFPILLLFASLELNAQNTLVFVGSYNWDKNKEGIYVYSLDTSNGRLKKVTSLKNILNPSYLTVSKNGKFIYACTESKTAQVGSVSSFQFDLASKKIKHINSQKSGGENPVYLTLDKNEKYLINANYTEGSISVYPLSDSGYIEFPKQLLQFTKGSLVTDRQDRSHIHAAVFSPDFQYIFFPDLGSDLIRTYSYNAFRNKSLIGIDSNMVQTSPGSGPRHFTFHPNGKYAYCIEELSGSITVYSYSDGKLDSIQHVATHGSKYKDDFNSADIHISPDGKFLYASNRGIENNIAIYTIEQNGLLKIKAYQSTFGNHPRNFALDKYGKFLIVANQISGDLVVFKRNPSTGLLKKIGSKIKVLNPSCVQIKTYEN